MTFRLICGDVMPGCNGRFEGEDRQKILDEVTVHAREAHGLTDMTPDILRQIDGQIVVV